MVGTIGPALLAPARCKLRRSEPEKKRRNEGASGRQIAEAMGWAPYTVRDFPPGLAKKGITVEMLERVCQVGPNKADANERCTVYRFADMPQIALEKKHGAYL